MGFSQPLRLKEQQYPLYQAYGFGGAGLTLSSGVAQKVVDDLNTQEHRKAQPILVVGAGITGLSIFIAQPVLPSESIILFRLILSVCSSL